LRACCSDRARSASRCSGADHLPEFALTRVRGLVMQTTLQRCGGIGIALAFQAAGDCRAEPAAPASAARPAAVVWVQIDGCLMDTTFAATEGRIDALNTRGQLVASAQTDGRGVFHLRVPARTTVRIRPANTSDEGMQLLIGESSLRPSTCLIDFGPG
jgi:hypothetical protein